MPNPRDNGGGVVAVAVDKEKSSQYALKWAVDNLFPRTKPLKLVHVVQRSFSPPSNPAQQEPNHTQGMEVLLPYRCFCTRRQVQFESVILHDPDVVRALIEYVSSGGIDTLILGTLSRGFSRIFKNSDVTSSILKWAPNFCNVYIISKGKVSAMRHASRSAQANHVVETTQPIYDQNVNHINADHDALYDELSVAENDNSLLSSGRLSTDSNCFTFYENLESGGVGSSSDIINVDNGNFEPLFPRSKTVNLDTTKDFSCNEGPPLSLDHMEDAVRRHKVELKQAMDLYHAACREAQISVHKLSELQDWNMKQEKTLKEVESKNGKCKARIEGMGDQEVKNSELKAEIKAMIEADERKKVLDALRQSHTVIKCQTIIHTLLVLFLSYLYISSFK
ncbi:hypothetical protein VNO77_00742 [Canavalia gladiata]|uniref:RING-type E3 ubiquitin transferase n=1 Tax=Canavalia gladiata TaxID=3824 RepID=A0AAN9R9L3_CANGL